ncbi:MAG: efflux RND transporter periplasmic adaptor subunit [Bacteroidetes bacterium]|nr:MAG: efflux RND transporter periplasmic adaptor subunit [Bacteroidota bacterium]
MSKNKRKKIWLYIILIVIVAIVVVLAIKKGQSEKSTRVAVEKVETRNIIETVSANGKIQPAKDIKISPYISGEVIELNVKEGDFVHKGDMLAKIDPQIYVSNFDRAQAALKSSQANEAQANARFTQSKAQFNKTKLDFQRSEKLWKQQVISDAEYDAAKSSYEVSEAEVKAAEESYKASQFQVNSARASLKEAKENLNRTSIYAPNDGTVSRLSVEEGERVTGASQFSSGTEIMRIANLNVMEVNVEVNETDIVRISLLDTALIEVDAYLDRKFKGVITEIATSANTTGTSVDQVTNFDVKIRMLKSSYEDLIKEGSTIASPFRPGMSATVEIQTETVNDVLSVPIQAVTTRVDTTGKLKSAMEKREEKRTKTEKNEKAKEYVFVVKEGKAKLTAVKTGVQDNMYIQILNGLNEGDQVIVAPYRAVSKELRNNDQVTVVDKKKLFDKEKKK